MISYYILAQTIYCDSLLQQKTIKNHFTECTCTSKNIYKYIQIYYLPLHIIIPQFFPLVHKNSTLKELIACAACNQGEPTNCDNTKVLICKVRSVWVNGRTVGLYTGLTYLLSQNCLLSQIKYVQKLHIIMKTITSQSGKMRQ